MVFYFVLLFNFSFFRAIVRAFLLIGVLVIAIIVYEALAIMHASMVQLLVKDAHVSALSKRDRITKDCLLNELLLHWSHSLRS